MIKVLWEKNKQTKQGDRLGDFLMYNSTRKKGMRPNMSITEKWTDNG